MNILIIYYDLMALEIYFECRDASNKIHEAKEILFLGQKAEQISENTFFYRSSCSPIIVLTVSSIEK